MAAGTMSQSSVTQIIRSGQANAQAMAELEKFRKTVVVMFTDIKGSTAYFEKYGDVAGLVMVHQCNDMLSKIVDAHKGRVVKTIGDAIMAVFEDCAESVQASLEMQKALITFNAPKPEQDHVFIRIGLNYGSGIVKSNDVFGDVVNVASRVESVAQPEQIVISDSLNQQVAPLGRFKLSHIGRYALKGKEGDRDLFEVVWRTGKPHVVASHTIVESPKFALVQPKIVLQHIKKDGSLGTEHEVKGQLTVGSGQAELSYPSDPALAPQHARFSAEKGQLFVEDISGKGAYVRLVATYTLHDGDIVMMGRQTLLFREKSDAITLAAATGTTMLDMSQRLEEPVAFFVPMRNDRPDEQARFPLGDTEVLWGRNKGTYTFPDDGFMSRTHAKVYQRGEDFFLEDAGSRNGTYVRTRGKTPVPNGSTVLIGGQILKVKQ
jgi:class 3 adenylate cyclase/pSer/pThr/pTyr-binding forkhead associated (FHA) protein